MSARRAWLIVGLVGLVCCACSQQQDASWHSSSAKGSASAPLGSHPDKDFWSEYAKGLHLAARYESNPSVQAQISWIRQHPYYLQQLAQKAQPYVYYVAQQVAARDMPAELALMPMIESAYDPFRYSKVGATGMWGLMPGTASGLGVRINWWYDGRRDILASTRAALDYLSYLHGHLHQWDLVIPAYDSGAGLIDKAVRLNRRQHLSTDLWALNLPIETKAYLPKLLAIAAVIRRPQHYGVSLPSLPDIPQFTAFTITKPFDLRTLAHFAGISVQQLRALNPGFRRWASEPGVNYNCLVPRSAAAQFVAHILAHPHAAGVSWQRHVVVAGDSLSQIANHYHTKQAVVQQINHLPSGAILRLGQVLMIPENSQTTPQLPHGVLAAASRHHYQHARHAAIRSSLGEDVLPGPQQITYTVQAHDSLARIAHHYHVRTTEIRFWNRLSHHHKVHPGEVLVLWSKHKRPLYAARRFVQVKAGDSLYSIAHANHLRLHALVLLNPQLNPHNQLHLKQKVWIS